MKNSFLPIFFAGIWIAFSEFIRNELIFKGFWINHYKAIGLTFKTTPINGVLWIVWSFFLAFLIYELLKKFSFARTIFLSWLSSFFMMWLTTYNLQVLPLKLLIFAVPLSLIEILIAGFIIKRVINLAEKFPGLV